MENLVEELGDPEGSPTNPTGSLAAAGGSARAVGAATPGSNAEIWQLAWPVMLSQALASSVSLADVAMVGRLGPVAQAAVGYAAQLFFVAQSALFAISMACVALMARAIGAGDPARSRHALAACLGLSTAISAALAAAFGAYPERILGWLNAAPEVVPLCVPYLRWLMSSSVLFALALSLESALRADRNTRTPMRITLAATLVKIVCNVLLIFGTLGFPRLELVGAGIATLVAQAVALLLFVAVTLRRPADAPTALRWRDWRGAGALLPAVVRISVPGVLERLVMNLAMLSYFAFLGAYGAVAAATYTIGIRILSFSWIPGTGYAQAVATLVGQNLGSGDAEGARAAGWRAARLALATAVVMGLISALARHPLAALFTVDPETILTLGPFMLCLAIAQPAMQLHFTLAGAFRGAGDTWTPLVAAFLGNWVFRVPLAFVAAHVFEAPLVWIWAVLISDHMARASWLLWKLRGRSFEASAEIA